MHSVNSEHSVIYIYWIGRKHFRNLYDSPFIITKLVLLLLKRLLLQTLNMFHVCNNSIHRTSQNKENSHIPIMYKYLRRNGIMMINYGNRIVEITIKSEYSV